MRECWDDTSLESQLMMAVMRFQRTQRKAPLHEKFNRSEIMLMGAILHLQMESEEPVTVSEVESEASRDGPHRHKAAELHGGKRNCGEDRQPARPEEDHRKFHRGRT